MVPSPDFNVNDPDNACGKANYAIDFPQAIDRQSPPTTRLKV